MAKISDLVKTYRMLSDPNAPDWSVKFVGGIAVAALAIAGIGAALFWAGGDDPQAQAPAASEKAPGEGEGAPECPPLAAPTPVDELPPACVPPAVLP
ncbi:MAG TPA: hypothetical protein VM582_02955 [Candidatus Thermoplasmatota archaeon]|nr:hypothetical protein [Candidatus Thermoplasmatota archaeon]